MFDIIIWLLVAFAIFGGSGSKKGKRRAQPRVPQNRHSQRVELPPAPAETKPAEPEAFGGIGDFFREFKELMSEAQAEVEAEEKAKKARHIYSEMSREDIARRKAELAGKKKRRPLPAQPAPAADECDYCTGEAEIGSVFAEHSAPMKPLVINDKRGGRDVATACRELGLNPVQQAVVWAEVLDKPLALRRKR